MNQPVQCTCRGELAIRGVYDEACPLHRGRQVDRDTIGDGMLVGLDASGRVSVRLQRDGVAIMHCLDDAQALMVAQSIVKLIETKQAEQQRSAAEA